jgi:hypothetical protein
LNPTDDAYTWIVAESSSYDNLALVLTFSGSPDLHASQVSYIKFDLSGISFPIQQARLNLSVVTGCNTPDELINVAVYGALDVYHNTSTPWLETGINWNNQPDLDPTAVAPLITMDEGVVQLDGGYHHWTDTGAGDFAEWLEDQRSGDGIATLRLEIVPDPNVTIQNEVWFDDHEGTAIGLPLCTSSGGPVLQVADAEGPLSITLLDVHATASSPASWVVWFGVLALPLLAWGLFTLKKRAG